MAQRSPQQGGEGLSLQTLVIAALAAGCAAVLTSYLWQRGTLISAAMTPVIVAVVSEVLKRPATTMRRAARTARTPTPARRERSRERVPLAHGAGAGSPAEGPSRELPAPHEPAAPMSSYKVYRSEGAARPRFGRIHWKIVFATAGAAFVIAVAALTLPELLFGSSVGGSQSTTFFGGTSRSHSTSTKDKTKTDEQKTRTDKQKTTTSDQKTTTSNKTDTAPTQSAPTQSTPSQSPSLAPQQSAPQSSPSTTPTPAPQQQTPPADQQQQAPAPSG
ncbi:MAG TPA: hypothetical protein VH231_12675 [Solirubrobacteraceae bacterium]|nr:hypothetical protein [Solirubrobacteraceae bacterium]